MARCDPALAGLAVPGNAWPERHWLLALGVSLALHGGLLAMKAGGKQPVALGLPLRVQLVPPVVVEPAPVLEAVAAPRGASPVPQAVGGQRERAAAAVQPVPADGSSGGPPVAPHVDVEAARALARGSYGGPAGKEGGSVAAESGPALADRPALPALAQRLGAPAAVVSETMVGGSRLIRFRDGRCLQIPVDVPAWRESRVVPTEWTTTNCPQ